MKYYTKKPKIRLKVKYNKGIIAVIVIFFVFNLIFYFINKNILPISLGIAEEKLKIEATKVINETALDIYSEEFDYSNMIITEKDNDGNITMLRADTIKLNYLSSKLVLESNEKISKLEEVGMEIPFGYISKNLMFYNLGPKLKIKLNQMGNIVTNYESVFESAGINQTRHKIYLNVDMKMKVIVPLNSKEVAVSCQIPISETIIVGKIPNTAIELNKN